MVEEEVLLTNVMKTCIYKMIQDMGNVPKINTWFDTIRKAME